MLAKNIAVLFTLAAGLTSAQIARTKAIPGACPQGTIQNGSKCCTQETPTCSDPIQPPPDQPCPPGRNPYTDFYGREWCCPGRSQHITPACSRRPARPPVSCADGSTLNSAGKCCTPAPEPTCTDVPPPSCPAGFFACPVNYFGDCCPEGSFCGTSGNNPVCFA